MPVIIDGTSGVNTPNTFAFKNRIISGGFTLNQRGYVSGTALATNAYGHDRWKGGASGGTYTFTQAATGVNTTITITAGSLIQVIEGANLPEGGTYTLSWTGTAQGKIGSGSFSASPVSGSITAGTNTNIEFNTGTCGNVQLEIGAQATSFDYRPYGTELALCQRYMYQPKPISGISMFPATSENGSAGGGFQTSITFPVTMRSQPTLVTGGAIDSAFKLNWVFTGSSNITSISGTHQGSTNNMTWYGVKTGAFQGTGQMSFNEISSATGYTIYYQAEL